MSASSDHSTPKLGQYKAFALGLSVSVLILASAVAGALADRIFVIKPLDAVAQRVSTNISSVVVPPALTDLSAETESVVVTISEQSSPSVVTVAIRERQRPVQYSNPFDIFGFGFDFRSPEQEPTEETRDIGSGFVIEGTPTLIVTNKHVVADPNGTYFVIDKEGTEHQVNNIYRDPANDLAILEITATIPALPLGDSSNLKVGQSVIAIGTALGEFRHTLTTGVISGLGRGIYAGDTFGAFVERLEDVIQTDAAINPGNSGGPLLNTRGEVIGVNVAVAGNAQNIGFAIPINIIKESVENFRNTGSFDRPFLGIQYQMITPRAALTNEIPQGAYVVEVVPGSTAAEAGLQPDDIVTEFDGVALKESDVATILNTKKIGDEVAISYWRNGETITRSVRLKGR